MHVLAIVIPAYKPDFFRAALQSVAAQTDKRFKVYIGDDCGPPEIAEMAAAFFVPGVEVVYKRFPENLGRHSLTAHWNRCVALSSEPWVWLFSDDDLMSPDCVAAINQEIASGGSANVVRFNTEVIDHKGRTTVINPSHPELETGADFIYARLRGWRNSYVVEYVFRREAFDRRGGFPEFPVAWCADDVAWFAFSHPEPIKTLARGTVKWRASGINITDAKRKFRREKLAAGAQFLQFVREHVEGESRGRSSKDWARARSKWWSDQIRYLMPVGPGLWLAVLRSSRGVWRRSLLAKLPILAYWNFVASLRALRGVVRRSLRNE
jgi:glycosyltransferase involved in cell wall biosynthesis